MTPVLAVVGPTASGKSALAMAVAERVGGEIVACDSVQVYRGFAIGCAKPSSADQARVRHHLIDVVLWHEPFDAERYRVLAAAAIADIRARGRVPIVCGGTGLYLRALRYGLVPLPPVDTSLRPSLLAREADEPGALYTRLRQLDPASAARIDARNLRRVVRALEITLSAGRPASEVRAEHGFAREEVPLTVVALSWPAAQLKERIAQRSADMLAHGLVDEVQALLAAGVSPSCRPLGAVGYREVVAVVQGKDALTGLAARIAASTWAYARRQRTWLRKTLVNRELAVSHANFDPRALADALTGG